MASHQGRDCSLHVSDVIEDMRLRKMYKAHRTYDCHTCSLATIKEEVVDVETMHTKDKRISHVVVHRVSCPMHDKMMIYDKMPIRCFRGNDKKLPNEHTCASCKFAEKITTTDDYVINQRKGAAPCKIHRTFYQCTNRNRHEQLNKENIHMCGYISCEFYKGASD